MRDANSALESRMVSLDKTYMDLQKELLRSQELLAQEVRKNEQLWADYNA